MLGKYMQGHGTISRALAYGTEDPHGRRSGRARCIVSALQARAVLCGLQSSQWVAEKDTEKYLLLPDWHLKAGKLS